MWGVRSAFGGFDVRPIATQGDLAEEPDSRRLHSPFLAVAGKLEGRLGALDRFIQSVSQQIRLAQRSEQDRASHWIAS